MLAPQAKKTTEADVDQPSHSTSSFRYCEPNGSSRGIGEAYWPLRLNSKREMLGTRPKIHRRPKTSLNGLLDSCAVCSDKESLLWLELQRDTNRVPPETARRRCPRKATLSTISQVHALFRFYVRCIFEFLYFEFSKQCHRKPCPESWSPRHAPRFFISVSSDSFVRKSGS